MVQHHHRTQNRSLLKSENLHTSDVYIPWMGGKIDDEYCGVAKWWAIDWSADLGPRGS